MKQIEYLNKILKIILVESVIIFFIFLNGVYFNGSYPMISLLSILIAIFMVFISSTYKLVKAKAIALIDNYIYVSYQNSGNNFVIRKLGLFSNKKMNDNPLPLLKTEDIKESLVKNDNLIKIKYFCTKLPNVENHEDYYIINDSAKYNMVFESKFYDNYIVISEYCTNEEVSARFKMSLDLLSEIYNPENIRKIEIYTNKREINEEDINDIYPNVSFIK